MIYCGDCGKPIEENPDGTYYGGVSNIGRHKICPDCCAEDNQKPVLRSVDTKTPVDEAERKRRGRK